MMSASSVITRFPLCVRVRVSFYLSRGWKSTINNFIIMPPWLHMYTEPRSINHDSQCVCVCTVCGVLSVCVLQGYLYLLVWFSLCVWESFCVSLCCAFISSSGQRVLIGLLTDGCIIHCLMESDRWLPLRVHACVSTCLDVSFYFILWYLCVPVSICTRYKNRACCLQ